MQYEMEEFQRKELMNLFCAFCRRKMSYEEEQEAETCIAGIVEQN